MQQPSVTMIILYADRPQFFQQALDCFRSQTYENKWLLIYDNGVEPLNPNLQRTEALIGDHTHMPRSIGVLRNKANGMTKTDIIAHLDVDDWSHPNRLTEQVALLKASGADAVGYNELLFWRGNRAQILVDTSQPGPDGRGVLGTVQSVGEAWIYSNPRPNYALGTSLCYWRKTWERSPFTDGPKPEGTSEYHHWFAVNNRIRVEGVGSIEGTRVTDVDTRIEPRMIARIHGSNTGSYNIEAQIKGGSREWKRVPSWDARVRDILEGK